MTSPYLSVNSKRESQAPPATHLPEMWTPLDAKIQERDHLPGVQKQAVAEGEESRTKGHKMTGFRISRHVDKRGTGFHVAFTNGYTLSVQFGPGTYSDHHDADFQFSGRETPAIDDSSVVEIAVIAPKKSGENCAAMLRWPDGDTVQGYQTPEQVAKVITLISRPDFDGKLDSLGTERTNE